MQGWHGLWTLAPRFTFRKDDLPRTTSTRSSQNSTSPRTPVNNANTSDRISQYPTGRTHRAGDWHKKEALPSHSQDALLCVSSSEAGEFLLKERVVVRSFFLAFQPLHVALNPRVVALGH